MTSFANQSGAAQPATDLRALLDWWYGTPALFGWKQKLQQKYGESPDLGDPNYNYEAAFRAGLGPHPVPYDSVPHWPSQFKGDDHPNRFIQAPEGLLDTRSGQIVPRGRR